MNRAAVNRGTINRTADKEIKLTHIMQLNLVTLKWWKYAGYIRNGCPVAMVTVAFVTVELRG